MIECKSGGGGSVSSVVRTVHAVVVDTRTGAIVRTYGGEVVMPWETVHACILWEAIEAPHLIAGRPVTVTEMRR